jgi:hypothetical protein
VNVSEPVGRGFVAGLNQPGGNFSGFAILEASMGCKWLELLTEIAPGLKRVAIMFNPDTVRREMEAGHSSRVPSAAFWLGNLRPPKCGGGRAARTRARNFFDLPPRCFQTGLRGVLGSCEALFEASSIEQQVERRPTVGQA